MNGFRRIESFSSGIWSGFSALRTRPSGLAVCDFALRIGRRISRLIYNRDTKNLKLQQGAVRQRLPVRMTRRRALQIGLAALGAVAPGVRASPTVPTVYVGPDGPVGDLRTIQIEPYIAAHPSKPGSLIMSGAEAIPGKSGVHVEGLTQGSLKATAYASLDGGKTWFTTELNPSGGVRVSVITGWHTVATERHIIRQLNLLRPEDRISACTDPRTKGAPGAVMSEPRAWVTISQVSSPVPGRMRRLSTLRRPMEESACCGPLMREPLSSSSHASRQATSETSRVSRSFLRITLC
jgi:hypothetical protein